jgi:RNA polymerase sigma-70 factor (ECF subfamily)
METISLSLLERLREPGDGDAWRRLVALYTPLLQRWLSRTLLQPADRDDLVQDVLSVVVRRFPEFRYAQRPGACRAWLRAIAVNCLRDFWKAQAHCPRATGDRQFVATLDQLEDPHSDQSRLWDQEHDRHVLQRLMEFLQPEFKPTTWQAFRRHVLDGAGADAVAAEVGMSVNAVLIAKSRVLGRLREEMRGLVEEPADPAGP